MTRALALLRPEPGWSASAEAARAEGLEVVGHPLFVAAPVSWTPPQDEFDGLLAGSAAAFRQGGDALETLVHVPVLAVGAVTAAAACAAGFVVVRTGQGGLQQLLDAATPEQARYLRLAGEEHVPLAPHSGQIVTERVVYRMIPRPLEHAFVSQLQARPVVALHSAAAAKHFAQQIDRLAIARDALPLLALGTRVAEAAGLGWAAVHIADRPDDAALLAKASALCK